MDEQGIDVEALSINPYWYGADRDVARELIAIQNEKLAEVCAREPGALRRPSRRWRCSIPTSPPSSSRTA